MMTATQTQMKRHLKEQYARNFAIDMIRYLHEFMAPDRELRLRAEEKIAQWFVDNDIEITTKSSRALLGASAQNGRQTAQDTDLQGPFKQVDIVGGRWLPVSADTDQRS